jgi:hypothetical protein
MVRPARILAAVALAIAVLTVAPAPHAVAATQSARDGQERTRISLDRVRDATAAFHRLDRAVSAGWSTELADVNGITCIADPNGTGGMGIHYVDVSRVDGTVDPLRPEALIYAPDRSGARHLVAVEYVVIRSAWEAAGHTSAPALFGRTFELVPAGNRYGLPDFYELHAWIWRANPLGTFNDWNPRVHCPV